MRRTRSAKTGVGSDRLAPESSSPAPGDGIRKRSGDVGYKMADLVQLTGVGREAIRFYVNYGLLPAPHRTSRNMAWYTQEHIDRIELIRKLQQEQFLPLKVIKSLLQNRPQDLHFSSRHQQFFSAMTDRINRLRAGDRPFVGRALYSGDHVLVTDIEEFRELGWIAGSETAMSPEDREVIHLWEIMLQAGMNHARGIRPRSLGFILDAVDQMFEGELELYRRNLSDWGEEEATSLVTEIIPALNRLFAILHDRRIRMVISRLANGRVAKPAAPRKRRATPARRHGDSRRPAARN